MFRDGPLQNLVGRGGGGRSTKKYSLKEKLNEEKFMAKKIHTRNLMTKKKSCGSKIPHPPIAFLMVRPLQTDFYYLNVTTVYTVKFNPQSKPLTQRIQIAESAP